MKIIQVVPSISEEASGPSYSVKRLCESLIEQDNVVSLLALNWSEINNPPRFLSQFALSLGPKKFGFSREMHHWLKLHAVLSSVDVIHNHGLWMMPNVYSGWITKNSGIPYVVSPRGTLSEWAMRSGSKLKNVFWPLLQKPAIKHADCFHATAESEYKDIRRMGFKQPVAIISNGIDLPKYHEKPERTRRKLLFLGRLHPVKGIDFILQAWQQLQEKYPDWDLQIAGPDDHGYADKLKSMVVNLGLNRVEFLGALYGEDKFQAYRQADLYVLPSHSENFGMTVAEALASGTPAIVSKGAPWGNLPLHNAGWWINIGYEPLLACLENVLDLPQNELDSMGKNGRKLMSDEYSWHYVAMKMSELYQWVVNKMPDEMKPEFVRID